MKPDSGHFRRLRNSTRENVCETKECQRYSEAEPVQRERLHTASLSYHYKFTLTHLASPAESTASHVSHPGSQRRFFFPQNISFPATGKWPATPSSDVIDIIDLVASSQVQLQSHRRSRVGVDELWLQGIRGGGYTRPRISFRAFRGDARSICRGSQAKYSSTGRGQTQPRTQPDP